VTYLWDTTTFSALMRRDAKVRARVAALTPADRVVICTITRGEVLYGLARLPEGKRRSALEAEAMAVFGQVVCLAVPEAAADQYAAIKWDTERQGTPLDENDSGLRQQPARWKPWWSRQTVISSGSVTC
jgi:predicted nucleic acid-binding protein